jgi:capsular exopolysaccharide synthesis family protein
MKRKEQKEDLQIAKVKSLPKEVFGRIIVNIESIKLNETEKVFAVSSALPGEGKTITVYNLACESALTGKKTLLIDCDLRKPRIHKMVSCTPWNGLINVLADSLPWQHGIKETGIQNLWVMTSGGKVSNPRELLASQKMSEFIGEAKNKYDYIFIDTPPILITPDTITLSKVIDGIILVVRSNVTNKKAIQQSISALQLVKANLMGVILNDLPATGSYYSYNTYQYGYGYEDDAEQHMPEHAK